MYRNCASRLGCCGPSFVLRFNCSEYLISDKQRATVVSLTGGPCRVNSSAIACVDWLVHRSALIGSPAVVCSTIRASSAFNGGAASSTFLLPAPAAPVPSPPHFSFVFLLV